MVSLPTFDAPTNQFLDSWLPHKQHKNDDSLKAVEKVREVEDQRIFEGP
jgi:hypothetical protein